MAGGTKLASEEDILIHDMIIRGLKLFKNRWKQKMESGEVSDLDTFLAQNNTNPLFLKQRLRNKQLFHRFATEPDFVRNVSSGTLEQCIQQLEAVSLDQLIEIRLIQPELRHLPRSLFHQQRFVNEVDQCVYRLIVDVFLSLDNDLEKLETREFPKTPSKLVLKPLKTLLKPLLLGSPSSDKAKCSFGREILLILGLADYFEANHPLLKSSWWRLIVEIPDSLQEKTSSLKKVFTNNAPTTQKKRLGSVMTPRNLKQLPSGACQDSGSELQRVFAARRKELKEKEIAVSTTKENAEKDLENDPQMRGRAWQNKSERQKESLLNEKMARVRKSMECARSRSVEATTRALKESGTVLLDIFLNLSNLRLSQIRPAYGPLFLYQDTNWIDCQTMGNGQRGLGGQATTASHLSCYIYELTPSTSLAQFVRPVDITSAVRIELRSKMTAVTHREAAHNNRLEEQLEKLEEVEETVTKPKKALEQKRSNKSVSTDYDESPNSQPNGLLTPEHTTLVQNVINKFEPESKVATKQYPLLNSCTDTSKEKCQSNTKQNESNPQNTSKTSHSNVPALKLQNYTTGKTKKTSVPNLKIQEPTNFEVVSQSANSSKEQQMEFSNQRQPFFSSIHSEQGSFDTNKKFYILSEPALSNPDTSSCISRCAFASLSKENIQKNRDSTRTLEENKMSSKSLQSSINVYPVNWDSNLVKDQNEQLSTKKTLTAPNSGIKSTNAPQKLNEALTNKHLSTARDNAQEFTYNNINTVSSKETRNFNESRGHSSGILHGLLNYWCHATPQNSTVSTTASSVGTKNGLQKTSPNDYNTQMNNLNNTNNCHLIVRKIKKSYDIIIPSENIVRSLSPGSKAIPDKNLNKSCNKSRPPIRQKHALVQQQTVPIKPSAYSSVVQTGPELFSQKKVPSPVLTQERNDKQTTLFQQHLQPKTQIQSNTNNVNSFNKLHPRVIKNTNSNTIDDSYSNQTSLESKTSSFSMQKKKKKNFTFV